MKDIFGGRLVRFGAADPQEMSKAIARWNRDSEYARLLYISADPLRSANAIQKWFEEDQSGATPAFFFFTIRTIEENELIGGISLHMIDWTARDTFVGIFIGEREYWGKGCGTEAMRLLLRYAFLELNMQRVSLEVFDYNPRAIRSYEKIGFCHEGRLRQFLNHEGKRWDMLFMGIRREEWRDLD